MKNLTLVTLILTHFTFSANAHTVTTLKTQSFDCDMATPNGNQKVSLENRLLKIFNRDEISFTQDLSGKLPLLARLFIFSFCIGHI
jgi:hypothetical protein